MGETGFDINLMDGEHVLITGGGSGLGFAIATELVSLGAKVSICGRNEERLAAACEQLSAIGRLSPSWYRCDVREEEQVKEMFLEIRNDSSPLTALLNNAAGNFYCASEDLSSNGFKTVVDIVLIGTFHCSKAFGNLLIDEKRKGSILNIVTTYTESGSAFVLPSACAKAGVQALTKTLAFEWAEYGIRVNAIAPGPFPTKGAWSRLLPDPELEKKYQSQLPTKRFGDPKELACLAVFLLSDMAPYLTGDVVTIDGAESLASGSFNFLAREMPRQDLKKFFAHLKSQSRG